MKLCRSLSLGLGLLATTSFAVAAPVLFFEVTADSTLSGQDGYLVDIVEPDGVTETLFLYEDSGGVRVLASRQNNVPGWEYYAPDTYLAPAIGDGVGTTWTFIPNDFDGTLTATLEGFESLTVPAGPFDTALCIIRRDATPTTDLEVMNFAAGVGLVYEAYVDEPEEIKLHNYFLAGGTGYFPLAAGNWWQYQVVSPVSDSPVPINLLYGNVPNPFNPRTEIPFELATDGHVRLRVFDLAGHLVRTLVDGPRVAGRQAAVWDGRNQDGHSVAAGVYHCRFEAGQSVQTRAMTLVR